MYEYDMHELYLKKEDSLFIFDIMFLIIYLNECVTSSTGVCPEGYEVGLDYGCYKFVAPPKPWNEARMDCQSVENSDLVVIQTEEEHGYIMNRTLGGDWWIGKAKNKIQIFCDHCSILFKPA